MAPTDRARTEARGGIRNRFLSAAIGLALAAALWQAPALAQPITTTDAVARLFETGTVDPAWFTESFLAQVPAQQIAAILAEIAGEVGPFVDVAGEGNNVTVRFENAEMDTQIVLDGEGRIAGLLFGPPVPIGGDIETFVQQIAALPGKTSVLVLTNGDVESAHRPELALGVGSAFKLAILRLLMDEIDAGERSWEDVVAFDPAWRSLPTGILQAWPEGTPLTLATLANLMISISDNTATDALIAVLGRDRIEATLDANHPFLTTGEVFRLKAPGSEEQRAAYIGADEAGRRQILADLADEPLPDRLVPEPVLEIEWFFSAFELCALLEETADAPAFAINPGLADNEDWQRVAFKGGSEAGVLNASTWLVAEDGTTHCVVATWNNTDPVNDQQLFTPYAGILRELAER